VDDRSLDREWAGRVFLNPPGKQARAFADKLLLEWHVGRVTSAVYIAYSLEQLRFPITAEAAAVLIPWTRVRYIHPDTGEPGASPWNGSAVLLLSVSVPDVEAFVVRGRGHGAVLGASDVRERR
jgi:hypothetical protein